MSYYIRYFADHPITSKAIHQALLHMGCETGQGNGLALPMPAADLERWQAAPAPQVLDPLA